MGTAAPGEADIDFCRSSVVAAQRTGWRNTAAQQSWLGHCGCRSSGATIIPPVRST